MPAFCAVVNCAMRGNRDNVKFFRIPAALKNAGDHANALSRTRQEMWIKALKRGPFSESQLKHRRVCFKHFISGAPAQLLDKENPDWIPSQNMGYTPTKPVGETQVSRFQRSVKRRKQAEAEQQDQHEDVDMDLDMMDTPSTSREVETESPLNENHANVGTQTDLTVGDLAKLFDDINFCNTRIYSLEDKLKKLEINEDSFKNDDNKTCYFTGLPQSDMLFIVFETLKEYLPVHHKTSLSPFQQLILTFMKLRLNLPFKFLAHQFSISPSTVSRIFYQCIDILYNRFNSLVFWPTRESLQQNMPACFKECFGNRVAVVIDCFEVFIETPSKLLTAAQCWSNYKHHETVKFLIGITPQGTISYISETWGGRASDKYIAENCGFLNLILPNDIVLADRGFLIKESVEILRAHLEIPAFTRGKNQLNPVDIENTRNIATVRIHVERVIGLLKKKYKTFQGPIPMSMVSNMINDQSALDKIIVVCSAFINMCPSQIPLH